MANAITNLFAKKTEPAIARPAHEELTQHLAAITAIADERKAIAQRASTAQLNIATAERHAASIKQAQEVIDSKLGDARYAGLPEPDLTADRKILADLERTSAGVIEAGRVAAVMHPRLQADNNTRGAKLAALQEMTNRLLWQAALEVAGSYGPELLEAEEQLNAVHRKAFVAALAADNISDVGKFGKYMGSKLYMSLRITKPELPAFWPTLLSREQMERQRQEDWVAMQSEASRLIDVLLNGEE